MATTLNRQNQVVGALKAHKTKSPRKICKDLKKHDVHGFFGKIWLKIVVFKCFQKGF